MALAEQRGSIRCVRQNHVKSLRNPLTHSPHQDSAKLVDAASAVEPDNAVSSGRQDQECAVSLSSEEQHPFGPARNRYIRDDRAPPAAAGTRSTGGAAPTSIAAGGSMRGAACVDAATAKPATNAGISARIEPRSLYGDRELDSGGDFRDQDRRRALARPAAFSYIYARCDNNNS
jgi:hypothetical protein